MSGALTFADFVLDIDARELRRGKELVTLSPKAFQLLAILARERPKALSKADLMDQLWPDTFVVEKNLANLVGEIRRALDDHPSQPRFIRTVARFGYAFREATRSPDIDDTTAAMAHFQLVWMGGRRALLEGEHVLGRDPALELFFDSTSVSRRHACIRIVGTRATIEDLGSKNGTYVGERRVERMAEITDGDTIRIGSVGLRLRAMQTSGTTDTVAASRS